jgi:glutamine cyclotransferase
LQNAQSLLSELRRLLDFAPDADLGPAPADRPLLHRKAISELDARFDQRWPLGFARTSRYKQLARSETMGATVTHRAAVSLLFALLLPFVAWAVDDGGHIQVSRARVLNQTNIPVYTYRVAQTYPHDRSSYTEGFVMENGAIYEGTGLYGQSKLRRWDLRTGQILNELPLDQRYFGKGVTVFDSVVYQLTYLSNLGFAYDQATLRRKDSFRYVTQGWGLTHDDEQLLMSDGSSAIVFIDPKSFQVVSHVFVSDDVGPVGFLDELEYVDGKLYANVSQTNFIAIIAPKAERSLDGLTLRASIPIRRFSSTRMFSTVSPTTRRRDAFW